MSSIHEISDEAREVYWNVAPQSRASLYGADDSSNS
jgi:hypothetical protein